MSNAPFVVSRKGARHELWQIDGRGHFLTIGEASRRLSSLVPTIQGPASAIDRHRNVIHFEIRGEGGVTRAVAMADGWATLADWENGDRLLSECAAAQIKR